MLYENPRHRATPLLHFCFDHGTPRRAFKVGLEIEQFRLVIQVLDQFGDAVAGFGTGLYNFRVAAPFDWIKFVFGQLAVYLLDIRPIFLAWSSEQN